MKVNLKVSPQVFASLCTAINNLDSELNARCEIVTLVRSQSKGSKEIEVELEIKEDVDRTGLGNPNPYQQKPHRENLDALWDILGIFPCEVRQQTTLTEVQAQLRTIAQNLEKIYDLAGKSVDFRNPLNETIIEIREMARVALQLAAVLQLVE